MRRSRNERSEAAPSVPGRLSLWVGAVALTATGCLASIDESRIGQSGRDAHADVRDGGAQTDTSLSLDGDGSPPLDGTSGDTARRDAGARDSRRDSTPTDSRPTDSTPRSDSASVSWTKVKTPTTETLRGLWGSSSGKLWAVGQKGAIIYYDGTRWLAVTSPVNAELRAVWGSGPSDVWAVGAGGVIIHYDGSGWKKATSPVTTELDGVWGTSSSNAWAVGHQGVILHYASGSWTKVNHGLTTSPLRGVWASGPSDVWICGSNDTLLHDDGNGYKKLAIGSVGSLRAIFGAGAKAVWAVGHIGTSPGTRPSTVRYAGVGWGSVAHTRKTGVLRDVWPTSATQAWAVGYETASGATKLSIALYYDGSRWIEQSPNGTERLYVIWGDCSRNRLWIGGSGGVVYYRPCR